MLVVLTYLSSLLITYIFRPITYEHVVLILFFFFFFPQVPLRSRLHGLKVRVLHKRETVDEGLVPNYFDCVNQVIN